MDLEFMCKDEEILSRTCEKSDYDFVFGLIEELIFPYVREFFEPSEEMFKERFEEDYDQRKILYLNDKKIGFMQLTPEDKALNLTGIFLTKDTQGKGIGKAFMQHIESLGYDKIKLKVWENNPAHLFYDKMGYKKIDKVNHKYLMEK